MIDFSTTNIMCTLIVELADAAIGWLPLATFFTNIDTTICPTIVDARTPINLRVFFFVCMMVVMHAPRSVVVDIGTTLVNNAFVLEFSSTGWWLLQFALSSCGCTGACELAFWMAPRSDSADVILGCVCVCS
jgi:hypothetical protein